MLEQYGLTTEVLYAVGGIIAGIAAGVYGYFKTQKNALPVDPVVAGVGLEFGNRDMQERQIKAIEECAYELKRIADAITDRAHEAIQDKLDDQSELLKHLATLAEEALRDRRNRR